jgi:hypothetical protein
MPNVVKGSKQKKMVVVPHRPWRRSLLFLLVLVLIGSGIGGGYWYGAREAADSSLQLDLARQALEDLEAQNTALGMELAMLERGSVMDQQANDEVQATIRELRETVMQLEQDVQFYRQAMTSEFEDVGLVIGEMDLQSTADPGRYRYKLVLRQEKSNDQYLTGHVNVDIVGERAGQKVSIPLRDLSDEQEQLDIKLRFRYFQNIEGELKLPADFEPQQVEINAFATAPMAKSVNQSYRWVVEGE